MLQREISGYKSRTPIALRSTDQPESQSCRLHRCFSKLEVDECKIEINLKVSGAILSQKSIEANHNAMMAVAVFVEQKLETTLNSIRLYQLNGKIRQKSKSNRGNVKK